MCWINVTVNLWSLKALYLIEAIRMVESPMREEMTMKKVQAAHAYLSASLPKRYSVKIDISWAISLFLKENG